MGSIENLGNFVNGLFGSSWVFIIFLILILLVGGLN
jgi:hypothetical protein